MCLLTASIITESTSKGFFPSVSEGVVDQVYLSTASIVTEFTSKGFFPSVSRHVIFKLGLVTKSSSTFSADEWFIFSLSGVTLLDGLSTRMLLLFGR